MIPTLIGWWCAASVIFTAGWAITARHFKRKGQY